MLRVCCVLWCIVVCWCAMWCLWCVWCVVSLCGVGCCLWCVWCVVSLCGVGCCLWCAVCGVWCVWRGLARAKPLRVYAQNVSMCRFKTPPCVLAKRAHVENMRAFCRHTRRRFEPTHRDVLSIHTGRREGVRGGGGGGGLSSLLSSLLFSSLLSFRSCRLSPLLATMTSSRALSLCAHTALTCQRVRVLVLWIIPCLAELVRMKKLCKPRATWNEVDMYLCWKWVMCLCVCICLCLCLCLFEFGCVWLCEHVVLCDSMCFLRCVVGCHRCVGCCVVTTFHKRPKRHLYLQENIPQGNLFPLRFFFLKKIRIELQSLQFYFYSKTINLHHVKSVIISAGMVPCTSYCTAGSVPTS